MSTGLLARGLVLIGIVTGLLALGLTYAPGSRYVDDGTQVAFLVILLSLASWLPADVGPPLLGGVLGATAFGFYLFIPSVFAFSHLGDLRAGAWLGLCTVLIPIGYLVIAATEHRDEEAEARNTRGPGLLISTVGLVLIVASIWLDAGRHGPSYWNLAFSGHAVGLLMIILVILNAALLAGQAHASLRTRNVEVLVAATTFGYVEFVVINAAFNVFGTLGPGAWLAACGGVLLAVGVLVPRFAGSTGRRRRTAGRRRRKVGPRP